MRHLFVWYGPGRAIVIDEDQRELLADPEVEFAAILEAGAVVEVLKGSAYTGGLKRSLGSSSLSVRTPAFVEAEIAAKRFAVMVDSTDDDGRVYGGGDDGQAHGGV